jgi:prefoldin subunit 5
VLAKSKKLVDFRSPQQLTRALEPLKQALESHRRSLTLLERALREFEETLNQAEQGPEHLQVQHTSSSSETIELLRN